MRTMLIAGLGAYRDSVREGYRAGKGVPRRRLHLVRCRGVFHAAAKCSKGLLTIDLPKTKEAQEKVKHIEVKAA
ncbi:MAG TPA: hypothetical protein VFV10_12410 [Gammaproteobacteria bacterium]|nr:hypothetical protein [Gammaproteobacteria bacterium]